MTYILLIKAIYDIYLQTIVKLKGEIVMKLANLPILVTGLAVLAMVGCSNMAPVSSEPGEPEVLLIYPDGTMKLNDRYLPEEDVVIYPDGQGGERAAIKVRIEPLHPGFYRDTIVVKRISTDTNREETD